MITLIAANTAAAPIIAAAQAAGYHVSNGIQDYGRSVTHISNGTKSMKIITVQKAGAIELIVSGGVKFSGRGRVAAAIAAL